VAEVSTNTVSPFLGQNEHPLYPELPQLLRVTGPALLGQPFPIYPCMTQQYTGNLAVRDREPAYVFEPNSQPLGGAIYDGRLVGSFGGLPLYAVACCRKAVPSSVSFSPTSSAVASSAAASSATLTSQTFTVCGNFSFIPPAGVTLVKARCTGAGGGGAQGTTSLGASGNGGGGGGGAYASLGAIVVTPGVAVSGYVGCGGSGGRPFGALGQDSWFVSNLTVLAKGGTGGGHNGGQGGQASASIGTLKNSGGTGGTVGPGATAAGGGGGGAAGAGGPGGPGGNGTTGPSGGGTAGAGGPGPDAGGAGGAGGGSNGFGVNGVAPGGGGGGSGVVGIPFGANGADGRVIVSWPG
jgi:hypothetical protein